MYSNLAAAPREGQGWDRPQYLVTRFVGDCARVAGVDGIKYLSRGAGGGANVVLLNGEESGNLVQLVRIEELLVPDDQRR